MLLPCCLYAGNELERYAVVVSTIWPTCERVPYVSNTPPDATWSSAGQLPLNCTPEKLHGANLAGVVALGALQFSNKPQWARGLQRIRRDGLRLGAVNTKSATFYIGVSPRGVAGIHFVGTLPR